MKPPHSRDRFQTQATDTSLTHYKEIDMNANELETAMKMVDRVADASTPTVETEAVETTANVAIKAMFEALKPMIATMIDDQMESAVAIAMADFDPSEYSDGIMDVVNYNLDIEDAVADAVTDEVRNALRNARLSIELF